MPYANEHACRLRNPNKFQDGTIRSTNRTHDGKRYRVLMGRLKGEDTMTEQAYRYPKDVWSEADARKHCADHEGPDKLFEPASGEASQEGALEYRTFDTMLTVVRAEGQPARIQGHAAVFNQWSLPLGFFGGFREQVKPGAFRKTLREGDARALWNHNPDYVLGRVGAGTLECREDDTGLFYTVEPPDTQWARDLCVSIERRDVHQCSFGFRTVKDRWYTENNDPDQTRRDLVECELKDVSPVTFPAYPQTDVAVRTLFGAAGVDFTAVAGVLARAEHGLELTTADQDIVNTTIAVLRTYLPPDEPVQPHHSEGGDGGHVAQLQLARQRLELVRRAV